MGILSFSYSMGLPCLDVYFSSSYTILNSLWGESNGPMEVMVPSAPLALARKLSGPNECIVEVTALKEKRQSVENKW